MRLPQIINDARACRTCAGAFAHDPRPLLQASASARILIIGQAPGAAAHASGVPWDDRSGQRLRDWLGVTAGQFYDARLIALVPMGFCYPGTGRSGDLPPRPECAPLWHPRLFGALKRIELTIYIGRYAFERYLKDSYESITDAAAAYSALLPERIALPHPSPRNNIWLKKNPWFEADAAPRLRRRIAAIRRAARPSKAHRP